VPEITVIVPVLDRPENVEPTIVSIVENSDTEPEILFMCSRGDVAEVEEIVSHGFQPAFCSWPPGSGDYARKINAGTQLASTKYVFTGADDLRFHRGWDLVALQLAEDTSACVIGTEDLWNPLVKRGKHSTHSLVLVDYVNEFGASWDGPGFLYCEEYDHQCCDVELFAVAMQRGTFAFAWGSVVEHLHPLAGKAEKDATYEKGMARGLDDIRLYRERAAANGWQT
jgi:hypothetical protein